MAIELFTHNQNAYVKSLRMLNEEGKAAIIHPTGTGKSFIAFQYVDEHPEWNVCWLSPSDYIYKMQLENIKKIKANINTDNLTFITYAKLMNMTLMEINEINPTLIIMDEFHRAGASEWQKGVNKLLEMYPEAMLLGLSATNIRYLDNQRDMVDELFAGKIASQMTIGEAIVRGILKAPKYIISLYSYEREFLYYEDKIKRTKNKKVRDEAQNYLRTLKRALEKADGLKDIFTKHITKKNSRYIVFCSNYKHMKEMILNSKDWFSSIDKYAHFYLAYSNDPETSKAFHAFKEDKSEHLKLLFCIDMLNEGVHIDDIDGVILFRPTISPIIYKQQIGRAMSASSKNNPIIFDIVNNFDSINSIDSIKEEMEIAVNYYRMLGLDDEIENEYFEVIDEVRDCMEIFEQMNETLSASWDFMYEMAKQYYLENGNLNIPKSYRTKEGYTLGIWLGTQRRVYRGSVNGKLSIAQINKLNEIGMIWDNRNDMVWNCYFAALKDYYHQFKNIDVPCDYITEDGIMLGNWLSRIRGYRSDSIKKNILTKERIKALDEMGMIWDVFSYRWEKNYQAATLFYKEHGHLKIPNDYKSEDGVKIGTWIMHTKNKYVRTNGASLTNEQKQKLEEIGVVFALSQDIEWERMYEQAKLYYQKNGNLLVPTNYQTEQGDLLGRWIRRHRQTASGKTAIQVTDKRREKLNQIGMVWNVETPEIDKRNLEVAKEYFNEYGNLDIYGNQTYKDISLGVWLSRKRTEFVKGKISTDLVEQLNQIGMDWRSLKEHTWDEKYNLAKDFYKSHGHLKVTQTEKELFLWIMRQRQRYKKNNLNKKQIENLEKIGMKWVNDDSWKFNFDVAKEFYKSFGHIDVPVSYKTEDGIALGNWISRQRQLYLDAKLTHEQIEKLESINMIWQSPLERLWQEGYEHAKKYYEEYGNLEVSAKFVCLDDYKLGIWINTQRVKYRNEQLDEHQIVSLNELKMIWDPTEYRWNLNYEQASIYSKEHGDLNVPTTYKTKDGIRLGAWIKAQKKAYKERKKYSEEHFNKLNELGMEW